MPKFVPKDNSTGKVDMEKHSKKTWPVEDIRKSLKDCSVFSWGATDALRERVI